MEIGVNVHLFPYLTRKSIFSLKGKARRMYLNVAGVIEARSDEEMPERVAFCGTLMNLIAFESQHLPTAALEWLMKEAKARDHNMIEDGAGAQWKGL